MGPNEVQALIGQWVDLVGNGRDHDRREHDRHRHEGRGEYDRAWFRRAPYQPPYQPPYTAPYQAPYQPPYQAPYQAPYQPPYQAPLPASAYRQPLGTPVVRDHRKLMQPWSTWMGADVAIDSGSFPFPPRAAVVDAPLPTQANRDILPMSTGVPILPTQSAQITGRPQTLVYKIGRFVISNAGTAGGAADWIVNDIKIGNVSQFVQSGDVPGDMFAPNAIDTFVRFAPAQTAMDVVVVVTYIGLNESGCPFFGAMVGTAAV